MPAKRAQTLGSSSFTAIQGSMWEDPSFPAPGSPLTPLWVLCQAAPAPTGALGHCQSSARPAWLPGQAGQLACEVRLLFGRSNSAALQAPVLPPSTSTGPMHTHLRSGEHHGTRGVLGQCGQMPVPRAGSVGCWAPRRRLGKARQTKGSQTPREGLDQSLSQSVVCPAQSSQAGSAPSAAFSLCGQGWCQRRNLLISSYSSRSLPQASQPPFPPSRLDCRPSAAEPAGAGMCESHVSLLQTVGKCCSSELTAAALPQPQPRPWPRNRSWAGRPGTPPVHSRSAPLSVDPLPAPSPAGDKEHLSPQCLPQPPRVVKEGLLTWFSFRNSCFPALLCWGLFFFFSS